jgi:ribosomal protein S18 acetylase RimI-like enzyme
MSERRAGSVDPAPAVTIRAGGKEDLDAISAVFLACWRTSYRASLPERVIAMYDEAGSRALWRRSLERAAETGGAVLVAERTGDGVIGVIRIGSDPDRPSAGHVFSLYVHPAAQGLGAGRRLLDAADDAFASAGLGKATLWVFEANVEARGFYARLGWAGDGTVRVEPEYGEPELHLVRSVPAATRPSAASGSSSGEGSVEGEP